MISLITSAAYVDVELCAEFGQLPPAFLPLGTKRAIEHQVGLLRESGSSEIYLSLPASYQMGKVDRVIIDSLGVKVIWVPDAFSLGLSLLYCLDEIGVEGKSLMLLHGDTLFMSSISLELDEWGVAYTKNSYEWGEVLVDGAGRVAAVARAELLNSGAGEEEARVLVGVFSFSDAKSLSQDIRYSNGDFLTGLARYASRCDVAVRECLDWLDLGHVQTYYRARSRFAAARAFNDVKIGDGVVTKVSVQSQKLEAEARWLRGLPANLSVYSARLIDSGHVDGGFSYSTEYEVLPTLQELFVFGELDHKAWEGILESCVDCMELFSKTSVAGISRDSLYKLSVEKCASRLEIFERESGLDLSEGTMLNGHPLPSVWSVFENISESLKGMYTDHPCVMHGDFCFSNVLFNSRSGRVRLLDPRGTIDGSSFTIGGDHRYDMAKFAHSVVGRYDLIVAGHFDLSFFAAGGKNNFDYLVGENKVSVWLEKALGALCVGGVAFESRVISSMMISLFLSMLPLHADDHRRQLAFMANALRLYKLHFEK